VQDFDVAQIVSSRMTLNAWAIGVKRLTSEGRFGAHDHAPERSSDQPMALKPQTALTLETKPSMPHNDWPSEE
jgi:hypothetical protein